VEDVFAHQRNFWLGVEVVTAAGSNQDMHGKTTALDSSTDEAMAGSEAAFAKTGAELNTVGSAFFRRKTGIDCFGTEFECHLAIVELIPVVRSIAIRNVWIVMKLARKPTIDLRGHDSP